MDHTPFWVFVWTSILVHCVGLLILVLGHQTQSKVNQETESTPIDFVIVPPEESPEEPPTETKRKAVNNSVAKGKVEPKLPSATDKVGREETVAVSESTPDNQSDGQNKSSTSVVAPTPPLKTVESETQSPPPPKIRSSASVPPTVTPPVAKVKPLPSLAKTPKIATKPKLSIPPVATPPQAPEVVKPLPSLAKKPKTAITLTPPPQPPEVVKPSLSKTPKTAIAPTPPSQASELSPEEVKPLTSLSKNPKTAIAPASPIPPIATPSQTSESSPEVVKPLPSLEKTPQTATAPSQTQPREKLPPISQPNSTLNPLIKPNSRTANIPTRERTTTTTQPDLPPVATNLPPKPPSPSALEPKTPVDSGAASLLGGTQSRSLADDSGSSFFNPQANATQQALNSRGLDARQDLDLGAYLAEIKRRVRRNWKPSEPNNNRHTILAFSIQRNGQITNLRIIQSSGSEKSDRESLEALQKSAPFAALPAKFPKPQLKVQFNFNIYVNQEIFTPELENWQRF